MRIKECSLMLESQLSSTLTESEILVSDIEELILVLKAIGNNIESVRLWNELDSVPWSDLKEVFSILQSCNKLKSLTIRRDRFRCSQICAISAVLPNTIETLDVSRCGNICENHLKILISDLPRLQILSINIDSLESGNILAEALERVQIREFYLDPSSTDHQSDPGPLNHLGILVPISETVEKMIVPPKWLDNPDSLPHFPKLQFIDIADIGDDPNFSEATFQKLFTKMPNLIEILIDGIIGLTGECIVKCLKGNKLRRLNLSSLDNDQIQPATILDILLTFHESLEEIYLQPFNFIEFPSSMPVFPMLKRLIIEGPGDYSYINYIYVLNNNVIPDLTDFFLNGLKHMPNLREVKFFYLAFSKERVDKAIREYCPRVKTTSFESCIDWNND